MNLSDHPYSRLALSERLPVYLKAGSRGDKAEMELLSRTCPTSHTALFDQFISAIRDVMLLFTVYWLDSMRIYAANRDLRQVRYVGERMFELGVASERAQHGETAPPQFLDGRTMAQLATTNWKADLLYGMSEAELDDAFRASLGHLRAAIRALDRFCHAAGLDAVLLIGYAGLAHDVASVAKLLEYDAADVGPDAERIERAFRAVWPKVPRRRTATAPDGDDWGA